MRRGRALCDPRLSSFRSILRVNMKKCRCVDDRLMGVALTSGFGTIDRESQCSEGTRWAGDIQAAKVKDRCTTYGQQQPKGQNSHKEG